MAEAIILLAFIKLLNATEKPLLVASLLVGFNLIFLLLSGIIL